MKKYFLLIVVSLGLAMALQSCGASEKCPAYSSVEDVQAPTDV